MRTFQQKPGPSPQGRSVGSPVHRQTQVGQRNYVRSILHLQRTAGNQTTQRLLHADREGLKNSPLADSIRPPDRLVTRKIQLRDEGNAGQQYAIQRQGHTRRNVLNLRPVGQLSPVGDASPQFIYGENRSNSYIDEAGVVWELLPDWMNAFHQPEGHEESDNPNPNKKFIHKDSSGGSSEAIMRPDGTFVTTGPLQGTYNYSHPEGFWGNVGHFFQDIVPHFFNDEYEEVEGRDPRTTLDPDTFSQRYQQQVDPIGPAETTNVTDPVDRQITTQTGVVWVNHSSGPVLALVTVRNGRLSFRRFIDADLREDALEKARPLQPRGIQTVSWGPLAIFGLPDSVPATVARP